MTPTTLSEGPQIRRGPDRTASVGSEIESFALVAAGAELNARSDWGRMRLIVAALNNENPVVIETLFAAGPDGWVETTRNAARQLVEHCREDLLPSKYVQSAEEILPAPADRYQTINNLIGRILFRLNG